MEGVDLKKPNPIIISATIFCFNRHPLARPPAISSLSQIFFKLFLQLQPSVPSYYRVPYLPELHGPSYVIY